MKIHSMVLEQNEVSESTVIDEWGLSRDSFKTHEPEVAGLTLAPPEVAAVVASDTPLDTKDFVTAYEALQMQDSQEDLDMRPYLFDGNSKQHILLDSGSQVCAWPPDPGDLAEPGKRLKAVNGSKLNCYGYKEVT